MSYYRKRNMAQIPDAILEQFAEQLKQRPDILKVFKELGYEKWSCILKWCIEGL